MLSQFSNSKFMIPTMVSISILAAVAGFYISLKQNQATYSEMTPIEGIYWPNPKQINKFSATDHNGKLFKLSELQGKWSFIFFGYTHCPDICPISLSVMASSYQQLKRSHSDIQTIFVTVDPNRDTTDKLAQYVSYFNNEFIGLGGQLDKINGLIRQMGIAYIHHQADDKGNYLVDHSSSIFLIDPLGRLVGRISPPHNKEQIIQQFTKTKEFINAQG